MHLFPSVHQWMEEQQSGREGEGQEGVGDVPAVKRKTATVR